MICMNGFRRIIIGTGIHNQHDNDSQGDKQPEHTGKPLAGRPAPQDPNSGKDDEDRP